MKLNIATAAALTLLIHSAVFAQQPRNAAKASDTETTTAASQTAAPSAATAAPAQPSNVDSRELRREFQDHLKQYPPEVGKVLKLDPTLLAAQSYLAHYPDLAQFLAQNPVIAHNPQYFLESVSIDSEEIRSTAGQRMWDKTMEFISIVSVLALIAFGLGWLIRTVVDHRRWSRLEKVQADVHNKLLDRFTSNQELLAYMQTNAGRRFLESAPIQIDGPRQIAAPVSRILWSVQMGLVLAAGGIGLQLVSLRVDKDASQPMYALGIIALAIGIGFVVSAVVSYFISRRLGLFEPASPDESPSA